MTKNELAIALADALRLLRKLYGIDIAFDEEYIRLEKISKRSEKK